MNQNNNTPEWQHRSRIPQQNGNSPPTGRPMPGSLYNNRQKKSSLFPVLLSVFLTFVITTGLVWGLSIQGFLPGTEQNISRRDLPSGYEVGDFGLSIHTNDPQAKAAAEKLAEAVKALEDNYFKVLSPAEILEAMTIGMSNSMESKYTYYMSREEVQQFMESMSGNYSGIGATVSKDENTGAFVIVTVMENGPAFEAGLQAQDVVLEVDGKSTSNFSSPTELANNVKGEEGTRVVLTIERDGEQLEVPIVRGRVQVETIHTRMLTDSIGYMQITEFATNLPEQFEAGMNTLLNGGAEHIVFDLRGNPGGSADAVVKVLDSLLPEKLIAQVRGREAGQSHQETWSSDAEMMVPESMRYAILLNGGSASAAELFSGVLQDHGKAVLIGETTYGKGSGTILHKLQDGSAINITIFNYFLPSGRLIEESGLDPDIPAEPIAAEYRAIPYNKLEPDQDDALQKALDHLEGNSGA